ncbi:MAG: xylose isomerase [Rectinemataceae bacterium]
MMTTVFPSIPQVKYEGPGTDNPMAFKRYDPAKLVGGKRMDEHLRFAMAFWHSMTGKGVDPFGDGTMQRPWNGVGDPMEVARMRMRGIFELSEKLSIPFFCFHDRDIAPEGATLRETNANLDSIVAYAKEIMKSSPVRVLWGTANMFSNPRFMHGAATSPDPRVFAYAAAQVKKAIEVTKELGGSNYVFWGGREGYETLLNTDMKFEQDNLGRFFRMAVDYARGIGFTGQFLMEPKPKEPTKHQYDFDAAACHAFLLEQGLMDSFKLNIETNHATLAGHTMQHELRYARERGILGSVDANQGDPLLGWDTDQFPTDLYSATLIMLEVLQAGGLGAGGLNFDAKVRRGSNTVEDLALAHIAGMDTFARGLETACAIIGDGKLAKKLEGRYSGWKGEFGASILAGTEDFRSLEKAMLDAAEILPASGGQEVFEALVNEYL